ncbi:MAG: ferredoxin-type protein NapF [Siculibacillus sp.]
MSVALARRDLFRGRIAPAQKAHGLRPPTAIPETRFTDLCDGCAACAPACPETVIRLDADRRPVLRFEHGECTFCGACADVCRPGALAREGIRPWTAVATISGKCLAVGGVHCRTCGDACPHSALKFAPRVDGRWLPAVLDETCTGCGACVAGCPVDAVSVVERPGPRGVTT